MACVFAACLVATEADFMVLNPADYREHFVEGWPGPNFDGTGVGVINQSSYEWAVENMPLFESSDEDLNAAYYYRAKTYKTHLIQTDWADIEHVSSEFGPTVSWGGIYGTINAAAGHQMTEGRWLRNRKFGDDLARFWIGSQAGGGPSGNTSSGAFEPGIGHFANGTRGQLGSNAYSSWILSAAVKVAAVRGDNNLGEDLYGNPVTYSDLLPLMDNWWVTRSFQLRADCAIANHGKQQNTWDQKCLDEVINADWPLCYMMADGWVSDSGFISQLSHDSI
jgi:hypothetical protein